MYWIGEIEPEDTGRIMYLNIMISMQEVIKNLESNDIHYCYRYDKRLFKTQEL